MGGKARRLPQQPVNAQVDSPSPFITLKAPVEQIREIPDAVNEEVVSEAQEPSETTPPNWPSPVVYPFRQPKKLTSMASVDLPTFPRG
jgi:hypothetical protein